MAKTRLGARVGASAAAVGTCGFEQFRVAASAISAPGTPDLRDLETILLAALLSKGRGVVGGVCGLQSAVRDTLEWQPREAD
jgi:hypothetical protein